MNETFENRVLKNLRVLPKQSKPDDAINNFLRYDFRKNNVKLISPFYKGQYSYLAHSSSNHIPQEDVKEFIEVVKKTKRKKIKKQPRLKELRFKSGEEVLYFKTSIRSALRNASKSK